MKEWASAFAERWVVSCHVPLGSGCRGVSELFPGWIFGRQLVVEVLKVDPGSQPQGQPTGGASGFFLM